MTINTKKFFNENELPDLPGLGVEPNYEVLGKPLEEIS